MQVSQFKVVEIAKMSTQGGDTTKYRSRQDMIIQGGDTTKYRSRQYHTTRRRYNKVPEPPIQHYEAEIQQSTGAANTTYEAEIQQSTGAANTTYEAEIQQSTGAAKIHQEYQQPTQLQLLCTVTIIPRPRYTKSTNSRHSYNYSVLLQ